MNGRTDGCGREGEREGEGGKEGKTVKRRRLTDLMDGW